MDFIVEYCFLTGIQRPVLIKSSEMSGVSFLKAPVVSLLFGVIFFYI